MVTNRITRQPLVKVFLFWKLRPSFLPYPYSLRPQLKSQGLNHMFKCFAGIDFSICLTGSQAGLLKSMGLKHILKF